MAIKTASGWTPQSQEQIKLCAKLNVNTCIISPLHQSNFFLRQSIQLINQLINLPVSSIDLALEMGLVVAGSGFRQLFLQGSHLLDKLHHAVVKCFVGGIGEVDGADGNLFHVLVNQAIAVLTGTDAEGNTDIADGKPE